MLSATRLFPIAACVVALLRGSLLHAQSADADEVKRVIRAETETYYQRDTTGWKRTWVNDSTAIRTFITSSSYSVALGWDRFGPSTIASIRGTAPQAVRITRSNYMLRIDGALAYAEYDERTDFLDDTTPPLLARQNRALVKRHGEWGILSAGSFVASSFKAPGTSVVPQGSTRAACALPSPDSTWIAAALDGWQRESRRALHAPAIRFPTLVFFDTLCAYTLLPAVPAGGSVSFTGAGHGFMTLGAPHGGTIRLPNGESLPARLVSFASRMPNGDMFFVMSLPSIWRAKGRSDTLATAVFMHEFTHTQNPALGARIDALIRRGLPEEVDDDVIQKRFDSLPAFRRAYEQERDLLFEAARAPTRALALQTARRALAAMDARRAAFLRGPNALYADAEDVFLSMEGVGQWAAYLWLTDPQGAAQPADDAMRTIRRGGRWSQDEGLALLLVLSRLAPDAPRAMFGPNARTVLPLLRSAVTH
jgi:hypothetical protein